MGDLMDVFVLAILIGMMPVVIATLLKERALRMRQRAAFKRHNPKTQELIGMRRLRISKR